MRPAPPNTHLPNSPAGCIEIRPDLDCFSVQDNRSARRWMNKHEQREWQRGRQTQLAVVQIKAARALKQVNMTFLAARSAGCPRTMDTGHRIVQRRVRRIETRGTENRRGEGGWQAFSKLRKREVKIYWHTHTHNTLTYTDSNKAICNEEMLANSLCVIVEVLNNAICNEDMLANPYVWLLKFWIMLVDWWMSENVQKFRF